MNTTPTNWRALCEELADRLQHAITSANADSYYGENRDAVDRARTALAQPEPHPAHVAGASYMEAYRMGRESALAQPESQWPTDEEWDAIKDRLWRHYETTGYQGERFIYQGDFDTALDVARQELARFARPAIEPVPVAERLPALAEQAYVAFVQICKGNSDDAGTYDADEELVRRALKKLSGLEHNALPVPGAEVAPADRGSESSLAEFSDGGMPLG
jgi:hypothetical protein